MTEVELLKAELELTIKEIKTKLPQPKKEWVGLTDIEKEHICGKHMHMSAIGFVNFVEAKLKEKNT